MDISKNLTDIIHALDQMKIDHVCECNPDTYFVTCGYITFNFDVQEQLVGIGFLKPDITEYMYVSILNK
jgi:hypothetical protein